MRNKKARREKRRVIVDEDRREGERIGGKWVFFFKQKTAYEMLRSLVGSEMCIGDGAWYYTPAGMLALIAIGQLAVLGPAAGAARIQPAIATRSI